MGQKVNPHGLRIGIIKDWDTKWYANDKTFSDLLVEDVKVRKYIKKKLYISGISRIEIERAANKVKLNVHTAKPGLVIGKGGTGIEELRRDLERFTKKNVLINITEIKVPEMEAQLVAENIASQLEKRISFRRAMKQAMTRAMKIGAKGIKTAVAGRLGGAEIARTEHYHEGTIPLQTLRADIDYGFAEADTTYGKLGVKVWIYKGEVLPAVKEKDRRRGKIMLLPKRVKRRKVQRGRMRGVATRGNFISNGEYGLQATEPAWITSNQIEAARIALTRFIKRGGQVWIKIFPDKPVTKKPAETRMGSGKGSPEYWVAVVKPGRILFEIAGVPEETAREALRLATHKLPIKCKFVARDKEMGGEANES